jgi:hypothetical protein
MEKNYTSMKGNLLSKWRIWKLFRSDPLDYTILRPVYDLDLLGEGQGWGTGRGFVLFYVGV